MAKQDRPGQGVDLARHRALLSLLPKTHHSAYEAYLYRRCSVDQQSKSPPRKSVRKPIERTYSRLALDRDKQEAKNNTAALFAVSHSQSKHPAKQHHCILLRLLYYLLSAARTNHQKWILIYYTIWEEDDETITSESTTICRFTIHIKKMSTLTALLLIDISSRPQLRSRQ